MQEVQQVLFNYTTDNAEEFSSEISTIEDKQELLKLKKILIAARDCCNLVRTFGDDELKETFAKMELTKLPSLISEVQHHIDNINQKELLQVMIPRNCLSMKQWRILHLISAKSVKKN